MTTVISIACCIALNKKFNDYQNCTFERENIKGRDILKNAANGKYSFRWMDALAF